MMLGPKQEAQGAGRVNGCGISGRSGADSNESMMRLYFIPAESNKKFWLGLRLIEPLARRPKIKD